MSNRCGSCNKFVGIDIGEPEVNSLGIDSSGQVTAEVHMALSCAECGEELSSYDFSVEASHEDAADHMLEHPEDPAHELSVEEDSIESTEELGGTDRKGKPITSYRYMKKFYGFRLVALITCECGWEGTIDISDQEQASSFESAW